MRGFKKHKINREPKNGGKLKRSPVFSYYNNRPSDIDSTQVRQKNVSVAKLKRQLKHVPTYVASLLIVISLLYATTLSTDPKILIGHINGSDVLVRPPHTYEDEVAKLLRRSIFNHNKLTIDTNAVAGQIQQQFPEIQDATVSLPIIGRRPIIGLDPAEPTLILETTQKQQFIIGRDGRALINLSVVDKRGKIMLPLVKDDSGLTVEQGKAVLPKENVDFMTTIISQLTQKQIQVASLELPTAYNELRLKPTNQKYYVKFNMAADARQQAGTYLAVFNKLQTDHITPNEYIDVRVNERAYYK